MTDAQRKLAADNEKLIYFMCRKRFKSPDEDIESWYGVCAIGLCQAAETYNPELNIKFSTYACRCINNAISRVIKNKEIETISSELPIKAADSGDVLIKDTFIDEVSSNHSYDIEIKEIYQSVINSIRDKKHKAQLTDIVLNGLNCTEVAQKYGCSRQNINIKLQRFRKHMKERYFI